MEIAKRFTCLTPEDLLAAIGEGTVRADTVAAKLRDEYRKEEPTQVEVRPGNKRTTSEGIVVDGVEDAMVRLAACCKPLPGEPVIGYVTRGRGISVHRCDCPNALRYQETEPERMIGVSWGEVREGVFQVEMEAVCMDRERLLMDIMAVMAETKTPVNGVHVSVDKRTKISTVYLKLEVKSQDQLDYLIQRVSRVRDVLEVRRVVHHRRDKKDKKEGK